MKIAVVRTAYAGLVSYQALCGSNLTSISSEQVKDSEVLKLKVIFDGRNVQDRIR